MATKYGSNYLETEVLLAVMSDDMAEADGILEAQMNHHERINLLNCVKELASLIYRVEERLRYEEAKA